MEPPNEAYKVVRLSQARAKVSALGATRERADMDFEAMNEEMRAKAKACTSPEELLALAQEEGYELTDDQLEGITGGASWGCKTVSIGDTRDDIDESFVSEAFMTGDVRGDELD